MNSFAESIKPKKKSFSIKEDAMIIYLVNNIGTNWREIAKMIPGRTERQCRERYKTYLDPNLRHDPWTPEEDKLLIKLYNEIGPRWAEMTKSFPGRSDNSIKNRYNTHIIHRPRNSSRQSKKTKIAPVSVMLRNQTNAFNEHPSNITVQKKVDLKIESNNDIYSQCFDGVFGDSFFGDDYDFHCVEYAL